MELCGGYGMKCKICAIEFQTNNNRRIYCGPKCRGKQWWIREKEKGNILTREYNQNPDQFVLKRLNRIITPSRYVLNDKGIRVRVISIFTEDYDENTKRITERKRS